MFYNIFFYTFVIMQYLKNTTGQKLAYKLDVAMPTTVYLTVLFEATQHNQTLTLTSPYSFDLGNFKDGFYSYELKDNSSNSLDKGTFLLEYTTECNIKEYDYDNNYNELYKCKDN